MRGRKCLQGDGVGGGLVERESLAPFKGENTPAFEA